MPDEITVEVTGLRELEAKLKELAGTEAKKIVRAGLYAAGGAIIEAMQEGASSIPGELGQQLQDKKSWKRSTRMLRGDELAGQVKVRPTGALPEIHTGEGSTRFMYQPKGKKYHRSLKYMVRLLEGLSGGGVYHGIRNPFMTSYFDSNHEKFVERVIEVIKERLKL